MASVNEIAGGDGSNVVQGISAADLIYGFDPNGSTASVSSIATIRVASISRWRWRRRRATTITCSSSSAPGRSRRSISAPGREAPF